MTEPKFIETRWGGFCVSGVLLGLSIFFASMASATFLGINMAALSIGFATMGGVIGIASLMADY